MTLKFRFGFWLLLAAMLNSTSLAIAQDERPAQQVEPNRWRGPQPAEGHPWPSEPHFYQRFWFQMGDEFFNPISNNRFRVNDPYVATHPNFHSRREPKGNGMMLIPMLEPLREIEAARLVLELWGGHPESNNRRVTINGRSTYAISVPDDKHCNHAYCDIPLKITDLVQGQNALQFAVDGEHTFWGHFIVEEAGLDALLPAGSQTLEDFAELVADPPQVVIDASQTDSFELSLPIPDHLFQRISAVHYFAKYDGFDENGDGVTRDWHGMTKRKEPIGHVGSSNSAPYKVTWDTSMLPAQNDVQVRAVVEWYNDSEELARENTLHENGERYWKARTLYWQSAPTAPLFITHPPGIEVALIACQNAPSPFWSRAGRVRTCDFPLDIAPALIDRASLSICVWDGGAGEVKDYFTLNGHALNVAAAGGHDVIYSVVDLDPQWLQVGKNAARLLSDTEHHGIEVLYPGPLMTIRYRQRL